MNAAISFIRGGSRGFRLANGTQVKTVCLNSSPENPENSLKVSEVHYKSGRWRTILVNMNPGRYFMIYTSFLTPIHYVLKCGEKKQHKITHTALTGQRSDDSWTPSTETPLIFGKRGRVKEKPQGECCSVSRLHFTVLQLELLPKGPPLWKEKF